MTDGITSFKSNPGINPAALPEWRKITRAINDLERHRTIVTGKIAGSTRTAGATLQRITTAVADVSGGTADTRTGTAPTGLTETATGYFDAATGNPSTQVVLSWTAPATYTNGDPFTASGYEIWRLLSGGEWQFVTEVSGTAATLLRQPFGGATYSYEVRAQSADNGLYGAFSAPVTVTPPTTLAAMSAPSAPTLSSSNGIVLATWDGLIGGSVPPPQFRGVYAETSTDNATWTAAGQNLLTAGNSALGPFTAGTVEYVRFRAVDGLDQISTASPSASITVVGVDLSSIQSQVTTAQNTANAAQTTANGKNQITRSTAAASGSGVTTGDLWWQVDSLSTGVILASWIWDGSAWRPQTVGSQYIAALDAGKISTGYLDAARIATGVISASQLAIADFTNLFENPAMDPSATDATMARGISSVAGGHGYVNGYWYLGATSGSNNDSYAPGLIAVKPGDQFYLQADMWFATATGSGGGRVGFRFYQADKATTVSWIAGASTPAASTGGAVLAPATYSGTVTVPANAAFAQVWLSFSNNGETTNKVYIDNVLVNRRANANLIVDGSITTQKIASGAVTTNTLAAGAVTTSILSATAIDGMTITGATVQTISTASRGIKLTGSTLTGYDGSGNATFVLNGSTGAVTATGLNATSATISGAITATSGSITGTMLVSGTLATGTSGARVQMTSAGLAGYNSAGTQTFSFLTSNGTLSASGGSFTGVTVSGAITATSGSITGTLTIGSSGKITSSYSYSGGNTTATFDSNGISATAHTNSPLSDQSMVLGGDAITFSETVSGTKHTEIFIQSNGNDTGGSIGAHAGTEANAVLTLSGGAYANLNLGTDGNGARIWSSPIRNREYATAQAVPNSTDRVLVVMTPDGTFGALNGTLFQQNAYSDVISTRAVYTSSSGHFGTTASSRKVKHLHGQIRWNDEDVNKWLNLPIWEYEYHHDKVADPQERGKRHLGVVAEEVHDLGLTDLVYYEEREGHPQKGEVVGFAYEKMAVYEHMAMAHLYDDLMSLRKRVADLEGA